MELHPCNDSKCRLRYARSSPGRGGLASGQSVIMSAQQARWMPRATPTVSSRKRSSSRTNENCRERDWFHDQATQGACKEAMGGQNGIRAALT